MTIQELEHFRNLLVERGELLTTCVSTPACPGADEKAKAAGLIAEIRSALERVENRTYGICTVCQGEVEYDRLEVQPIRQVCLDCFSDKEKAALEEELFVAGKIHRALLPQSVARIPGFQVAAKSLAAGQVGGDFYDFLSVPNGGGPRVVVADSMGKGVPAAMLMSNLHGALRIFSEVIGSPGALIARLNQWLCRNVPVTKFISLTCVGVDLNSGAAGRLVYANAGHPPPILVRSDGRVERLMPTGGVLGVHEDFSYDEGELQVRSGDLLVLYTDGVTEAANEDGERFEEDRLTRFLCDRRNDPLDKVLDGLVESVQEFTGCPELEDDLTVIALRKS